MRAAHQRSASVVDADKVQLSRICRLVAHDISYMKYKLIDLLTRIFLLIILEIEFQCLPSGNVVILRLLLELLMVNVQTCRSITLLNCYELSSRLLYWIMCTFPHLETLNVHQSNHTTSVFDPKRLGTAPYNGRYVLKRATFAGYPFLDHLDTVLEYLSHCPELTHLDLQLGLRTDQQAQTENWYQVIKKYCPKLGLLRLDFGCDWILEEHANSCMEFYSAANVHSCGIFSISKTPFRKAPTLPQQLSWTAFAIDFGKLEFAARPWLWTLIHDQMPYLHTVRLIRHEDTDHFSRVNRSILEKVSHLMIADCIGEPILQSMLNTIPHKRGRTRDTVKIITLDNVTDCDLYVGLWDKLGGLEKMNIIDCSLTQTGQWYADTKKTHAREICLKQTISGPEVNLTDWLQNFAVNLCVNVLKISGFRNINSNDLRLAVELIDTLTSVEIEDCQPELTLTELVLVDSILSGRGGSAKVRK